MTVDSETSKQLNAKIASLLADGKWHSFGQFIALADCVSPERATRVFLYSRGNPEKPLDEQISRGRREILRQRLKHLISRGKLEFEGQGFERKFRLVTFDAHAEAARTANEFVARPSIKHLNGVELKDYLAHVAAALLLKAVKVKL